MKNKSAIQRMNEFNSKCTVLGVELFEFGFDEESDEVFITKIYVPHNEPKPEIQFPSFVSWVDYDAWHDNSALKNCLIYIPKGCSIALNLEETLAFRYFGHCAREIVVEDGHEEYSGEDGVLFNKDKTVLLAYPAGKTDESYTVPESVIKIENGAFYEHKYLRKLHISSNVVEIRNCQFLGKMRMEVDAENTAYKSVNGSLYSKDGKIAHHLFAHGSGKVRIEEGTLIVKEMYLIGDFEELYLPSSLKPIDGFIPLLADIQGSYEQIVAPEVLKEYLEVFKNTYEMIYY